MVELSAEIAPYRHTMARLPPRRQCEVQHVKHADNRSGPHPKSEQQANPKKTFNYSNHVAKYHGVRQYQLRQKRPVKTYRPIADVVVKISLESAVSEARPRQFVFAKKKKENGRGNAHNSDRLCCSRRSGRHQLENQKCAESRLASGPVVGYILLERFQFTAQFVDAPLQQIANGENSEQPAIVVSDRQMTEMALQHSRQRF